MDFDLKKRFRHIVYTLKHKIAFLKVEKKLRGKNTWRGVSHDLDKVFLYMLFWIDLEEVQKIHRKNNRHHIESNLSKTQQDYEDSVIDWECARMTKPDKPLNAYETLLKFYPKYKSIYMPIIRKWFPYQIPQKERE